MYEFKLITYPRTDSQFLTDDMEETALHMIDRMFENIRNSVKSRQSTTVQRKSRVINTLPSPWFLFQQRVQIASCVLKTKNEYRFFVFVNPVKKLIICDRRVPVSFLRKFFVRIE
ncbi:MAG: hypothetical protein J5747_03725 [Spirochaetaceae bacterium]|nr:hypothetical protein [Spirochaetaceae bacterium]